MQQSNRATDQRLITVVIPTVDRPKLLARALASALAQENVSLEVLVVDDGHGAGLEAADRSGLRHVRGISSNRQGQVPARRIGVREAKGELIAFLDDDDWWAEPDHLQRLLAVMPQQPALSYASGSIVVEDDEMRAIEEMPFQSHATADTLEKDNTLIVSGLLFDRRLIAMHGEFDVTFPYYWDWDWYLRLARADVPLIASSGSAVRISARYGSVSSEANIAARRADLDRLQAKHGLAPIPLRNHESIARDRQSGAA
jgi:glycosyltransferase involved in cell wall biosynthesis